MAPPLASNPFGKSRAAVSPCSARKLFDCFFLVFIAGAAYYTVFLLSSRFIRPATVAASSAINAAISSARGKGGLVSGGGGGGGSALRVGGAAIPVVLAPPPATVIADAALAARSLPPRAVPVIKSPLADFCTAPADLELNDDVAAAVTALSWDSINTWPSARTTSLMANASCFLTSLAHNELRFRPVHICTHDPAKDLVMADSFHKWKWWGANLDHKFVLAAGHSGTPLTAVDAARLRFTAARSGWAFESTDDVVAALRLPLPPTVPAPHAACSRERPFVLDVGGNIGYYTLVAAATGCSVVAIEPLSANTGRLFASILANGFEDHVTLYKNAIGKDRRLVTLDLNAGNPGASSVTDGAATSASGVSGGDGHGGGDGARETVATVVLDDLFDGGAERPRHPFTGRPIAPLDVAIVKVDVEGFDGAALWALRGMIEVGRPPLIKIEYEAPRVKGTSGCDNVLLMRWLYSLGYSAYGFGHGHPLTLQEWEEKIIPMLLAGKSDELAKEHKLPVLRELYLVHVDAPVPAVMESDGPNEGKRAPI